MNINNLPLVSVCIPAYNHEKYISDCIKSIINQTYKNIELIIIDDGSCDSTYKKIHDLETLCRKRFVNVVFQHKKHQGTCKTFNKLFSHVQGKYIFLTASDDISKPQTIEILVGFLEKHPDYAVVVGDNDIIDGNGQRIYWDKYRNNLYSERAAKYKTFGEFLRVHRDNFGTYSTLFYGNHIPNGYLIRSDILKKIGPFTHDAPMEDWWFMMQVSKYAKIKYLDRILFSYRWHGANTAANRTKMREMTDKTAAYEWEMLQHTNFDEMLPDVKKTYHRECRRRLIHRFIFYRNHIDDIVVIRLFGIIKIKYHKK